mgnify:CR=1 FL=1
MSKVTKEKRPGRKSPWGAVWKDSEGKRKSKFFRTQDKRDAYAKDLEERLNKHGTTALDVDVAKWGRYRELEEKLGGIPLEVAVDYYIKHQRPQATRPIDEVVKAFIEDRELAGVGEDYLRHVRKELDRFRIAFTGQPIALIGTPELTKWIYALPYVPETKGNYRKRLHALWRFAKLQGWISDNPVQAVPVPKITRPEPVIYNLEEVRQILTKAWETDRELIGYLALAFFAGMRGTNLERVDFEEIHFEDKCIVIPAKKAKGGRRTVIQHLPQNLWPWLKPLKKSAFTISKRDYYKRRERVLLRAEIPAKRNAFRHCFASYHVNWRGNANQTALILTHEGSTKTLFKHYHQAVKKKDAVQYFKLLPPKE